MRLGDLDALKEEFERLGYTYRVTNIIDNAPTVDTDEIYKKGYHAGFFATHGEPERPKGEWIPIKTRPLTDEERKSISQYYGFNYDASNDYAFHCPMPEEGQEILISTPWGVSKDRCEYDCTDDGMSLFSLEDRGDWEDVKAWMPLPEPYKDGGDKND